MNFTECQKSRIITSKITLKSQIYTLHFTTMNKTSKKSPLFLMKPEA